MSEYPKNVSTNTDDKSKFWYVSFVACDGKQKRRSTKVPKDGGFFKHEDLSKAQAKKRAFLEGYKIAEAECAALGGGDLISTRVFLGQYIERRKPYVSARTHACQVSAFKKLFEFLGKKADLPINQIKKDDAKKFASEIRKEVRQKSAKKDISLICAAFNDAMDSELIIKNPFARLQVEPDVEGERLVHEAFTIEEIRLMVEKFPPEWSSAVRCCFETYGQRMGDILSLRWGQFDFENRVVRIRTGKTGKDLVQPMRESFYSWAVANRKKDADLLHPMLYRNRGSASLTFRDLLKAFGIGFASAPQGGKRRQFQSKTFHCIRATCATLIQSSGISEGIAMQLVGHDSDIVHRGYVRPDVEQLRQAASGLPGL